MPTPTRAILALSLLLIAAALPACITAYEPGTGAPAGLPDRATVITPRAQSTNPPAPAPEVIPLATQPTRPTADIPASPAGRHLQWLTRALSTGRATNIEARFSDSLLAQVPPAQFNALIHEWRRDELGQGPVEVIQIETPAPNSLTAFIRGTTGRHAQVRLTTDESGRIAGLLLAPAIGFEPGQIENWGRFADQFATLPGQSAFGAYELTAPDSGAPTVSAIHTINASEQLAIGSAFKLYILGALAEEIAAGNITWDQPVIILDDLKSLPGGQLQLELEGMEYPVAHLAELMITISDNTAADHLINFLGRETVEAYMSRLHSRPQLNIPFLSTMDFFRIKLGPDRNTLAAHYAAANVEARREMLAEGGLIAETTPSLAAATFWRGPFEIERIGWYASADDLARLMADLHRLEQLDGMEPLARILRLNPGLAFDPRAWRSAAYKGGSEPGVLNMTWLLERHDGRRFILTLTWNNTERPIETRRLTDLAASAAALLASE